MNTLKIEDIAILPRPSVSNFESKPTLTAQKMTTNILNQPSFVKTEACESVEKTTSVEKFPLAEFAKTFIRSNKLVKSKLRYSEEFKSLSLPQQKSVRYQLQKIEDKKIVKPSAIKWDQSYLQLSLGGLIAIFLFIESLNFYLEKNIGGSNAWALSLLIEASIVTLSLSSGKKYKALLIALFIYNALSFSYLTYSVDYKKVESSQLSSNALKITNEKISNTKISIADLKKSKNSLELAYNKMLAANQITKAQKFWSDNISVITDKLSLANASLNKLYDKMEGLSVKPAVMAVSLSTWGIILVKVLLQLVSILFLIEGKKALKVRFS